MRTVDRPGGRRRSARLRRVRHPAPSTVVERRGHAAAAQRRRKRGNTDDRTRIVARMSRIAVVGTGYVGLTTGPASPSSATTSSAPTWTRTRSKELNKGEIPIVEAGLESSCRRASSPAASGSSSARREPWTAAEFVYLCVPDPPGRRRLRRPLATSRPRPARSRPLLDEGAIVVNKSTVPVGSTQVVERALGRTDVAVVSNPEFLREGSAVHDFLHPDRIVVGSRRPGRGGPGRRRCTSASPRRSSSPTRRRPRPSSTRQRLPRHQDLLRQRDRRGLRGGRRRRQRRRARHGLRQAHRPRVPQARPGLGRLVLPEGHAGRSCASPRTPATTSTCSRASSPSTTSSCERIVDKIDASAGGSLEGGDHRRVGPHLQGPHRRPPRLPGARDHRRSSSPARRAGPGLRPDRQGRRSDGIEICRRRRTRPARAPTSWPCSPSGTSSAGSTSTGGRPRWRAAGRRRPQPARARRAGARRLHLPGRRAVARGLPMAAGQRAWSASMSLGRTLCTSPTMPRSAIAEDRRLLVLVDGDDVLRALHAHHVLGRAGDAGGDVDVRLHDLAGLADLVAVRHPAGVDDRPGRARARP